VNKEQEKLTIALNQVENLITLLKGNEWEQYILTKLIVVKCELKRQLTNLVHSSKIKE
jgi:hypothetical protein